MRRIENLEHNPTISLRRKFFLRQPLLNKHQPSHNYTLLTNNVVLTIHSHAASSSSPYHVGSDKTVSAYGYALT